VLPAYDATGVLRSLRARRVTPGEGPKGVAPAGYSPAGLVLACGIGRRLLEQGGVAGPNGGPDVVIAEGEPDWLTWASRISDANETPSATLGVFAGAWTPAHAARIPAGARVVVRTHHDNTGDAYADFIVATFAERCRVFRSQPQGGRHGAA
jgi:hypothetical protein